MKVRTLTPHNNKFGGTYRKAEGDEYDAPDGAAQSLIAQGFVAEVGDDAPPVAAPKKKGRKKG